MEIALFFFFFALLGLVLLFSIKGVEMYRGERMIPDAVNTVSKSGVNATYSLARRFKSSFKETLSEWVLHPLHQLFVYLLIQFQRAFNRYFSKIIDTVKGKGNVSRGSEASVFLQDIAQYKREVDKDLPKDLS